MDGLVAISVSEASRYSLNNLYHLSRSSDSACLENRPSIGGVVSPGGEGGDNGTAGGLLLPGMEYTPTEQCQLQYGNESTHCTGMQVRGIRHNHQYHELLD
jgi:hypothetical protein